MCTEKVCHNFCHIFRRSNKYAILKIGNIVKISGQIFDQLQDQLLFLFIAVDHLSQDLRCTWIITIV